MTIVRQLTSASLLSVVVGCAVAGILHFVYPQLRHNDAQDEDHTTTILLTVTDAPHIFISLVAAVMRAAAVDKSRRDQSLALSSSSSSSSVSRFSALIHIAMIAAVTLLAGFALHKHGAQSLYSFLTYFVVLHSVAQIVWTVQQSSVDESAVFAAISGQQGSGSSTRPIPASQAAAASSGSWLASLNLHHHWWAPALLRPRGFDAFLVLVVLSCPISVWFMDKERGLDWYHWEIEHPLLVTRSMLPIVAIMFVVGMTAMLIRFCSVSTMDLPPHLRGGLQHYHFSAAGKSKSSDTEGLEQHHASGAATSGSTTTIQQEIHHVAQIDVGGPLAGFAVNLSTPLLGSLTGTAACVAFATGIVVPDRDLSVPLLAIPHAALTMAACSVVIYRCARILWPTRNPMTTLLLTLVLGFIWGVVDHILVDVYVDEPHTHGSFLFYAAPQLLHLVLDPSRTAWFLAVDERFQVSFMD